MVTSLRSGQGHMSVGDSAEEFISIHALGRERLLVLSCGLLSHLLKILSFARWETIENFCLSFLQDISKTPRTLIFRYLALYSISRYLCGHFVLSKTEYGVFSTLESSRAQDSRRDEARLFAPSRPRPRAA